MPSPLSHAPSVFNDQGSTSALQTTDGTALPATLSQDFHRLLADIEELIKMTASLTGDELLRAHAQINAKMAIAKAYTEAFGDSLAQQAQHGVRRANDYVRQQPWQTLGISAAVAFLLGLLIARRS
ncbi:MAG TPA: DUF883 family protein [Pseudomonas sp.]|nr:DUF883 family protein [Pseudomonas sp.]